MHYNEDFLKQLDEYNNRIVYARITALNFQESPIESVEGRITQGTVNLDGASSLRRTCSLTLVANDFNYQNYYWGLNTKFKLEIGLKNEIDIKYPDIIWFDQGIYIITSLSISRSPTNFTLSIQGKDKMCLLNGEVGGSIARGTDFGKMEMKENPEVKIPIPIKDIIKNMLHEYAGEPYHNIIINDLDDLGLELLEYRHDIPMYLYRKTNNYVYENATLNGDVECFIGGVKKTLKDLTPLELDLLVDPLYGSLNPKEVTIEGQKYYVAKVEFGQTAGYRAIELIYAGDLIANVGDSICTVLDKIKNMLGNFEYFYNTKGQFIFQRKKIFTNTLTYPIKQNENGEIYIQHLNLSPIYYFNESELLTSLNNQPNLNNVKNDYAIWGKRKGLSGIEIPVLFRYAIDKKPTSYKSFDGTFYGSGTEWREILYQMAQDYFQHHEEDDFESQLAKNNPQYLTGMTGYEQYYTDILGFWRQIYCPVETVKSELNAKLLAKKNQLENESDNNIIKDLEKEIKELEEKIENLENNFYNNGERKNWNKSVFEAPDALNFWIDFLDTEGELDQFNVKVIGARTKAVNDTNVKSIYFRGTPEVIFKDNDSLDSFPRTPIQKIIQVKDIDAMFSVSPQGKSAKDVLDELLYKHGYCAESVSITCVPVYHLEPNTRIHLTDKKTKLDGDYIVNKITIPLTYNGTMNISATKAARDIMG